ncbi:MAG: hypothetical protein SGJ03_04695 [Alphaproteobacteria bacterium]|nr:hypothetical protein [Alphaproteobacteria bacterium]
MIDSLLLSIPPGRFLLMTIETIFPRLKRTCESERFEAVLRSGSIPGSIPQLADIDWAMIGDLLPWIVVVDPDATYGTLRFVSAGVRLAAALGCEPIGLDYLEFVDPAIKGEAFDSTFLMLNRPCGLWQISPALTRDGGRVRLEYTGYPVFDHDIGRGLIVGYVQQKGSLVSPIVSVQKSTEWNWLEMRNRPER